MTENLKSSAQTARGLIKNMRIYYQHLLDRLIPFARGTVVHANYGQMEEVDQDHRKQAKPGINLSILGLWLLYKPIIHTVQMFCLIHLDKSCLLYT